MLSAGPDRCMAASRAGIPAVLVPGCVDMANFWGMDTVPEKYRSRKLYQWNPNITLLRTNVEENKRIGEMIAAAPTQLLRRLSSCFRSRAFRSWIDRVGRFGIRQQIVPASRPSKRISDRASRSSRWTTMSMIPNSPTGWLKPCWTCWRDRRYSKWQFHEQKLSIACRLR